MPISQFIQRNHRRVTRWCRRGLRLRQGIHASDLPFNSIGRHGASNMHLEARTGRFENAVRHTAGCDEPLPYEHSSSHRLAIPARRCRPGILFAPVSAGGLGLGFVHYGTGSADCPPGRLERVAPGFVVRVPDEPRCRLLSAFGRNQLAVQCRPTLSAPKRCAS